jgi:hypothetical protein
MEVDRRRLSATVAAGFAVLFLGSLATPAGGAEVKKLHLFILSGQSNMAGLNPAVSFTPAVTKAFAGDDILVVKDAVGGQPIRRWYKKWKPARGDTPKATGDLYDRLMKKVVAAMKGRKPTTVTFVWMQGERDARERHGEVYAASMRGLVDQLQADLKRGDVNFVIGRLSDFDNGNKRYPHWTTVRDAQVAVAESDPRGAWIDTDGLNGPKDGLHYTKDGYKEMGARFAAKAIELIRNDGKPKSGDDSTKGAKKRR